MVKITITDILNLLDAAKIKGLVPFGSNDTVTKSDWKKYNSFGDYRYIYFCFNVYGDCLLDEKNIDERYFKEKDYVCGREYLTTLGAYYKCYIEVFGKEPFNLAQEFFNYLEIGEEYGWLGEPSFDICIGKQITNEHTLTVNLIHGYVIHKLPILFDQSTLEFDFSVDNKNLMVNINLFHHYFKYPHRGYANKKEKDERVFLNGMNVVKAAKETIKRNRNLLKLLEKNKK